MKTAQGVNQGPSNPGIALPGAAGLHNHASPDYPNKASQISASAAKSQLAEAGQSHIYRYSGFRCTHSFPVVVLTDYDDSSRKTLQGSLSTASRGGGPERDWPMPEIIVSRGT